MPRTKGARNKKLKLYRGIGKSFRYMRSTGRRMGFNPSPIFTETFLSQTVSPNTGGVFKFNMTQVPQLQQYLNLYQKYRILRVQLILLPQYYAQDQNVASFNVGTAYAYGLGRIAYAQNDSPNQTVPASEAIVLQDNGCKIKTVKTGLKMSCRPVPNTLDTNGVQMTFKQKYINLRTGTTGDVNVDHFGITYWYTQPVIGTTSTVNNDLQVYYKITFQLADPR